jgi:hypothetical protein
MAFRPKSDWLPRVAAVAIFTLAVSVCVAPIKTAMAAPFVVGTMGGQAGGIVANLVSNAQGPLDISVLQSNTLDAAFFNQIDAFVFGNGQGPLTITLGMPARTNLLGFVTNGGHAYMGLDLIGDGNQIASDFGFNMVDRQVLSQTGMITNPAHPITTGPFQPASLFPMSVFGHFDNTLPAGGSIIGTAPHGNALAFLGANALQAGSGKVYIYSDEVPLFGGAGDTATAHNNALFQNALVDMGAMLRVPEPGTLALFGLGLAGLAFARRRKAA